MDHEYLSIPESARKLRISTSSVERMLQRGELPRLKIGRRTLIRAVDLTRAIREEQPRKHESPELLSA